VSQFEIGIAYLKAFDDHQKLSQRTLLFSACFAAHHIRNVKKTGPYDISGITVGLGLSHEHLVIFGSSRYLLDLAFRKKT